MSEDEGNVSKDLEELMGEDMARRVQESRHGEGLLSSGGRGYESVNKMLATSVQDPEKQYRQALLMATFLTREDATRVVAALDERRRYDVDITPVVDLITAWMAVKGAEGGRERSLVITQTHQSLTTNLPGAIKNRFFNKNKKEPLS